MSESVGSRRTLTELAGLRRARDEDIGRRRGWRQRRSGRESCWAQQPPRVFRDGGLACGWGGQSEFDRFHLGRDFRLLLDGCRAVGVASEAVLSAAEAGVSVMEAALGSGVCVAWAAAEGLGWRLELSPEGAGRVRRARWRPARCRITEGRGGQGVAESEKDSAEQHEAEEDAEQCRGN